MRAFNCDICQKPIAKHATPQMLVLMVQRVPDDDGKAIDAPKAPKWANAVLARPAARITAGIDCLRPLLNEKKLAAQLEKLAPKKETG